MDISPQHIRSFLDAHQLPAAYALQIQQWFAGLATELLTHQKSANRPFLVGLHGAQGSGKTTLAACLTHLLCEVHQCLTITLSLDDFYLSQADRQQLASNVHPLLATRGVPGTHDLPLLLSTLDQLCNGDLPVTIAQFNKANDDRFAEADWPVIDQQPQIIIIEGWCMGALPQTDDALSSPINPLEQSDDPEGHWRRYVNEQLTGDYQHLFALVDYWLMLKAPDFDCIYHWRLEQEQALAAQVDTADHVAIMDAPELARFIQLYQRLTEHCLYTLPSRMDTVLELNSHRQIIALHRPNQPKAQVVSDLLIFTDLDGSLLDHHHYRHDEADELLSQLADAAIPVIPVSSKTRSEIERLRHSLNNAEPFICENGAAICIPVGYFSDQPAETAIEQQYWLKTFVKPRRHWLDMISTLKPQFGTDFTSFADAGIDGIIAMTGLDVHAAARAAHREYGEAIAWHGSPARQKLFIEALQKAGAQVLQGGRFLHVSGACDKGQALHWLLQQYQYFYPQKSWQTLAIGDSDNDIAMLQQADLALLIPSPVHGLPQLAERPGIYIAPHTGPRGWAAGVQEILDHKQQFGTLQPQEHAHG